MFGVWCAAARVAPAGIPLVASEHNQYLSPDGPHSAEMREALAPAAISSWALGATHGQIARPHQGGFVGRALLLLHSARPSTASTCSSPRPAYLLQGPGRRAGQMDAPHVAVSDVLPVFCYCPIGRWIVVQSPASDDDKM